MTWCHKEPGASFKSKYTNFQYKDKMASQSPHLYNGNPTPGKISLILKWGISSHVIYQDCTGVTGIILGMGLVNERCCIVTLPLTARAHTQNDPWVTSLLHQTNDFIRADSRFAPSQWEMPLQCNGISHWLGANLDSSLHHHNNCVKPHA